MSRQSCAEGTENPQDFTLFAGLPAVLRLLRLADGASPEQLDLALELEPGSYATYESGLTAPLLGTLDRILDLFEEELGGLQGKLEAMRGIDWPPGGDLGDEEQPEEPGLAAERRRFQESL